MTKRLTTAQKNALAELLMAQQGMKGAQSGPAQESDSAYYERILQRSAGQSATIVGGIGGGVAGMASTGGNPVGGGLGTVAGAMPGMATIHNARSPNIQDLWAHQLMQRMRRYNRGLD